VDNHCFSRQRQDLDIIAEAIVQDSPRASVITYREFMEATMKPKCFPLSAVLLLIGGVPVAAGGYAFRVSPEMDPTPRIPVTVGIVRPTIDGVHRNQALASIGSGARTPWGPFASPFVSPLSAK